MRASFITLELSEKFLSLLRVNNMLSRHILSDVFFYVFEMNFLSEYICYILSISYPANLLFLPIIIRKLHLIRPIFTTQERYKYISTSRLIVARE